MRRSSLLLSLLSCTVFANPWSSSITVMAFTTQHYPLQHTEFADSIYFLDAVEKLEEETTRLFGQNPNPTIATTQAKTWLVSEAGKQFQQQLQQAYEGVTEGWKIGVMKVPAVVFLAPSKEPAVIYGQPDLKAAIALYEQTQE